jgi:hypothetical protein
VLVEFRRQAQALVVLCDGLRLVPVGGYDGVVEDLLLRLGLLAHAGGAGAVLLLLEYTAHGYVFVFEVWVLQVCWSRESWMDGRLSGTFFG